MRLVIVSHTPHYRRGVTLVGWGPTVREIDYLSRLFDEVVHVAPLHQDKAPESALPYEAACVRVRAVPPVGGNRIVDKFRILGLLPTYTRVLLQEIRKADAVHVRCPANISLLAIVLLAFLRHPKKRWVKYAGNWQSYPGESWSYGFQRWWLKKGGAKADVTVNGQWPDQPDHVHTFLNPCLREDELEIARQAAQAKRMSEPVRLLFVGQLVEAKGVFQVLEVIERLKDRNLPVVLDMVGDGLERPTLERRAVVLGIRDRIRFHGWLPRDHLGLHYQTAHLLLFPSRSEGWPKVLSEAMAYGVVPVASRVSSIPQYLSAFATGQALEQEDSEAFANAVAWYVAHPEAWKKESENGVKAARRFTYAQYLQAVQRLFDLQENSASSMPHMGEPLWAEAIGE